MKYNFCIMCVLALLMAGCSDSHLKEDIAQLQSAPIAIDIKDCIAKFKGSDSTFSYPGRKSLIVYVDSLSCSTCFMSRLIDYYEINDSLQALGAELIVILNPKPYQKNEIEHRIKYERYPFWCVLDTTFSFQKNNPHIPDNPMLHSFLIDEYGKVLVVGDPTRNSKIQEMVFDIIKESGTDPVKHRKLSRILE